MRLEKKLVYFASCSVHLSSAAIAKYSHVWRSVHKCHIWKVAIEEVKRKPQCHYYWFSFNLVLRHNHWEQMLHYLNSSVSSLYFYIYFAIEKGWRKPHILQIFSETRHFTRYLNGLITSRYLYLLRDRENIKKAFKVSLLNLFRLYFRTVDTLET